MKTHYSHWDALMADPDALLPMSARDYQLGEMHRALQAITTDPVPSTNDWRLLSDCVNMLETLVTCGPWLDRKKNPDGTRDKITVADSSGLLADATNALAEAGRRHIKEGKPIRLTGEGLQALRFALEDYEACLNGLSERTMISAHRLTEKRLHDILAGKRQPHDIEILELK